MADVPTFVFDPHHRKVIVDDQVLSPMECVRLAIAHGCWKRGWQLERHLNAVTGSWEWIITQRISRIQTTVLGSGSEPVAAWRDATRKREAGSV